jgi:CubicO group peptidase (beta-lactamase class C family)
MARLLIGTASLLVMVGCSMDEQPIVEINEFEPAYTKEEVLEHHRKVPDDDIWWNVTGDEMAWMHKNAHQLFPTVNVYRGGPVRELEYNRMDAIADFPVGTPQGEMRFEDFLYDDQSTTLGVVILHKGKVVFESYPRMQDFEKITYWSTSKVFAGTLIHLLEERGEIDTSKPIEFYIDDLAGSAFGGITVRNVLDHATGLDCGDEYEDRQSCYYRYSMAIGDGFRDERAPDNPYDFLATVKPGRHAEQGAQFSYSGANNFLLSWLVEEVTGYPFQDVLTKEIWHHLGAESDASFIAYRYGIPLTHGGFLCRMRDLARFGLLFTPSYAVVSDRKIISDEYIEFLQTGANPNLRRQTAGGGYVHSIYQWGAVYENGSISQGGWGGQGLLVNPEWDVVAVYTAYFKDDYSEVETGSVVAKVLSGIFGDLN